MKPSTLVKAAVIFMTIGGLSGLGFAEEPEKMSGMMERGMMGKEHKKMRHHPFSFSRLELKETLKLNEEQEGAVRGIMTDYRKFTIKKGADIRIAEVELGELLEQKEPNREGLKKKVEELGGHRTELMMYRIDSLLKLREVLTKEQHEKFKAILKERMGFLGGRGRMHGMGGGMMR